MNVDTASTLTHADLSREVGVSVTTIKSYRRKFPGFLPIAGFGKPIRFTPKALDAALKIRECFDKGLSVRESRKRLESADFVQDKASIPPPSGSDNPSTERMDEFIRAAGSMMQSVSKLADSQTATDNRLARLEKALEDVVQTQAANQTLLSKLTTLPTGKISPPVKRIVNVRSSEGQVDSYSLDDQPGEQNTSKNVFQGPPPSLLDVPVAILAAEGEFLGLPGKLTLREMAAFLLDRGRLQGEMQASWQADGASWRYELKYSDGKRRALSFASQTAPTGTQLAVLTQLFQDDEEVPPEKRMEYFREVKNQQQRK